MPTTHTPSTTPPKPWIWLQENEPSGAADDCACRLDATGLNETPGAAFSMCAMHQQASAMLTALRETLGLLEHLEREHKATALIRALYIPSDVTRTIPKIHALVAAATPGPTPNVRTTQIPTA